MLDCWACTLPANRTPIAKAAFPPLTRTAHLSQFPLPLVRGARAIPAMHQNRMAGLPLVCDCIIRIEASAAVTMQDSDTTVLELRIEGLVQGVGYRAWAAAEA